MATLMSKLWHYMHTRWERVLFGLVGLACLGFTFYFLLIAQIASASALFAMAFFSFFYSNLARFKRFKGLGFEAELWEDKQKEAADLIDRLKNVVSVYTRETVMNAVMRGRWGGSDRWQKRFDLIAELEGQHNELGQNIDFTELKHEVESVFIFDICSPLSDAIRIAVSHAKEEARKAGTARFGNPVSDLEGWNGFHQKLSAIVDTQDDWFERSKSENIAESVLSIAERAVAELRSNFSTEVHFPDDLIDRLKVLVPIVEQRPIVVTPRLIEWADDQNAFSSYR